MLKEDTKDIKEVEIPAGATDIEDKAKESDDLDFLDVRNAFEESNRDNIIFLKSFTYKDVQFNIYFDAVDELYPVTIFDENGVEKTVEIYTSFQNAKEGAKTFIDLIEKI